MKTQQGLFWSRKIIALMLCIMLLLPIVTAEESGSRTARVFGEKLYLSGYYDEALGQFLDAMELDKYNEAAQRDLINTYYKLGRYQDVVDEYNKYTELYYPSYTPSRADSSFAAKGITYPTTLKFIQDARSRISAGTVVDVGGDVETTPRDGGATAGSGAPQDTTLFSNQKLSDLQLNPQTEAQLQDYITFKGENYIDYQKSGLTQHYELKNPIPIGNIDASKIKDENYLMGGSVHGIPVDFTDEFVLYSQQSGNRDANLLKYVDGFLIVENDPKKGLVVTGVRVEDTIGKVFDEREFDRFVTAALKKAVYNYDTQKIIDDYKGSIAPPAAPPSGQTVEQQAAQPPIPPIPEALESYEHKDYLVYDPIQGVWGDSNTYEFWNQEGKKIPQSDLWRPSEVPANADYDIARQRWNSEDRTKEWDYSGNLVVPQVVVEPEAVTAPEGLGASAGDSGSAGGEASEQQNWAAMIDSPNLEIRKQVALNLDKAEVRNAIGKEGIEKLAEDGNGGVRYRVAQNLNQQPVIDAIGNEGIQKLARDDNAHVRKKLIEKLPASAYTKIFGVGSRDIDSLKAQIREGRWKLAGSYLVDKAGDLSEAQVTELAALGFSHNEIVKLLPTQAGETQTGKVVGAKDGKLQVKKEDETVVEVSPNSVTRVEPSAPAAGAAPVETPSSPPEATQAARPNQIQGSAFIFRDDTIFTPEHSVVVFDYGLPDEIRLRVDDDDKVYHLRQYDLDSYIGHFDKNNKFIPSNPSGAEGGVNDFLSQNPKIYDSLKDSNFVKGVMDRKNINQPLNYQVPVNFQFSPEHAGGPAKLNPKGEPTVEAFTYQARDTGFLTWDEADFYWDKDKEKWFVTIKVMIGDITKPVDEIGGLTDVNPEIVRMANLLRDKGAPVLSPEKKVEGLQATETPPAPPAGAPPAGQQPSAIPTTGQSNAVQLVFDEGVNDHVYVRWNYATGKPEVGVVPNAGIRTQGGYQWVTEFEGDRRVYEEDTQLIRSLLNAKSPGELSRVVAQITSSKRASIQKDGRSIAITQANQLLYGEDVAPGQAPPAIRAGEQIQSRVGPNVHTYQFMDEPGKISGMSYIGKYVEGDKVIYLDEINNPVGTSDVGGRNFVPFSAENPDSQAQALSLAVKERVEQARRPSQPSPPPPAQPAAGQAQPPQETPPQPETLRHVDSGLDYVKRNDGNYDQLGFNGQRTGAIWRYDPDSDALIFVSAPADFDRVKYSTKSGKFGGIVTVVGRELTATQKGATTTINYDYDANKVTTAAQAVGAASLDAVQNPQNYDVKIGGVEAVLAADENYYSKSDLDTQGNIKQGSQRIVMASDTAITVTKKAQASEKPAQLPQVTAPPAGAGVQEPSAPPVTEETAVEPEASAPGAAGPAESTVSGATQDTTLNQQEINSLVQSGKAFVNKGSQNIKITLPDDKAITLKPREAYNPATGTIRQLPVAGRPGVSAATRQGAPAAQAVPPDEIFRADGSVVYVTKPDVKGIRRMNVGSAYDSRTGDFTGGTTYLVDNRALEGAKLEQWDGSITDTPMADGQVISNGVMTIPVENGLRTMFVGKQGDPQLGIAYTDFIVDPANLEEFMRLGLKSGRNSEEESRYASLVRKIKDKQFEDNGDVVTLDVENPEPTGNLIRRSTLRTDFADGKSAKVVDFGKAPASLDSTSPYPDDVKITYTIRDEKGVKTARVDGKAANKIFDAVQATTAQQRDGLTEVIKGRVMDEVFKEATLVGVTSVSDYDDSTGRVGEGDNYALLMSGNEILTVRNNKVTKKTNLDGSYSTYSGTARPATKPDGKIDRSKPPILGVEAVEDRWFIGPDGKPIHKGFRVRGNDDTGKAQYMDVEFTNGGMFIKFLESSDGERGAIYYVSDDMKIFDVFHPNYGNPPDDLNPGLKSKWDAFFAAWAESKNLPTPRQLSFQEFFKGVDEVLGDAAAVGDMFSYFLPDSSIDKWVDLMDRVGIKNILTEEDYFESLLCKEVLKGKVELPGVDEGVLFVQSPEGFEQIGSRISSDKQAFTAVDDEGREIRKFLYTISFAVNLDIVPELPQQVRSEVGVNIAVMKKESPEFITVLEGEQGQEFISVKRGESYFWKDGEGNPTPIVFDSEADYEKACIIFSDRPLLTKNTDIKRGKKYHHVCTVIGSPGERITQNDAERMEGEAEERRRFAPPQEARLKAELI